MGDIKSVSEYVAEIKQLNENKSASQKLFFRGHYLKKYKLLPSIYRGSEICNENVYFHEMIVRCPNQFVNLSHLDCLVKMQHYGVHTRLLDVTENPLVALYFACKNYSFETAQGEENGEVIVFNIENSGLGYNNSDKVLMLSCLPTLSYDDIDAMYRISKQTKNNKNTQGCFPLNNRGNRYADKCVEKLYSEICKERPSFRREMCAKDILQPVFVQPNRNNERIIKQDGAFIICGLGDTDCKNEDIVQEIEKLTVSRIGVSQKKEILKELDCLGINEASLFPEMDRVASYIMEERYYY